MSEELRENKMGTMPVRRLVLSMSLPMMIAMLVQALYNVVDSYFVAKLSENALTAVGMVFPFQNLMIAVGVGTGVGVNAFLSRSLGEKNYDAANRAAENGVFLAVLSTLVFTVAGLTLAHPFIAVQTDIPDIVSSGTAYMRICGGLSFGLFLEIMFERLLQATGRTFYTMLTQGTGAIINIIMDPVLIFGLGPFPRMEVAGAAAATVLGQIVAAVLAVLFNLTCNHDIHPTLRGFRPNGPVIRNIYSVGAPSIILNSIGSVMTFGMNQILFAFSSTAVAVFNVYFKLQSFVFMPVFGLNNGMVPIVSYNYGARKRKRLVDTVKFSALLAVAIMLVSKLIGGLGIGEKKAAAAPAPAAAPAAGRRGRELGNGARFRMRVDSLRSYCNLAVAVGGGALGDAAYGAVVAVGVKVAVVCAAARADCFFGAIRRAAGVFNIAIFFSAAIFALVPMVGVVVRPSA